MIFGDFGVTRGFASGSSKENISKLSLLAKAFERVAQHMTPRDFSVQTRESLSSDGFFGRSFCLWFFALHWGDPFKDIRTSTPPWKNLTMETETSVRRFLDQVVRSKFGEPRWRRNLKGLFCFFFRWRVYQQKVMQWWWCVNGKSVTFWSNNAWNFEIWMKELLKTSTIFGKA